MNRKAHALIAAALSISGLMASSSASACGFIACGLQSLGVISAEQSKEWDRTWHETKENIPGAAVIDQTLTQAGRAAGNAALMSSGGVPAVIAGNLVADQWGRQVRREREVSHPSPKGHFCVVIKRRFMLSHPQDVGSSCQFSPRPGLVYYGQVHDR